MVCTCQLHRVAVDDGPGTIRRVPFEEILGFKSDCKYVMALLDDGRECFVRGTPAEKGTASLEKLKGREGFEAFVQIHRGYLVNQSHMQALIRSEKKNLTLEVELTGGKRVPVSRRYHDFVRGFFLQRAAK